MVAKPAIEGGSKTREEFLLFGSPIIEDKAIESVTESLKSCWIGTGPKVKEFEKRLSEHLNVKHCVLVNSCTAALHLSLLALGLGPGDEVIVPTYTFCATANSVLFTGAKPVFIDADPLTLNIDINKIEQSINAKTKAIMPVHIAGLPVDMDKILAIAQKHNLYVVEDSAHAIEGKYQNQMAGTIGDLGCYSFYATKNLTTGEGGLIATNNDDYEEYLRKASLHGLSADAWKRYASQGFKHYEVDILGYKYNMTDIQAALGIAHLEMLPQYLKAREKVWQRYNEALSELPIITPAEIPDDYSNGSMHSRHLYIIRLELDKLSVDRDHILEALQAEGVGCGIHYKPLHLHKHYQETLGIDDNQYPNANKINKQILSLPMSPKLSEQDSEDVINAVSKVLSYYSN